VDGFMKMFGHVANILKGYAIAIGVAVAIAFVWMWWKQRQEEARTERQVRIQSLFAEQARLALAHLDIAKPRLVAQMSPEETTRYHWYLMEVVAINGQIARLDNEGQWRSAIVDRLRVHREALSSKEFELLSHSSVSSELRQLIKQLEQRH